MSVLLCVRVCVCVHKNLPIYKNVSDLAFHNFPTTKWNGDPSGSLLPPSTEPTAATLVLPKASMSNTNKYNRSGIPAIHVTWSIKKEKLCLAITLANVIALSKNIYIKTPNSGHEQLILILF